MSRSLIACALDAGTTTVARVKTTSHGAFTMTMCSGIDGGLDDFATPSGAKLAGKLVAALKE